MPEAHTRGRSALERAATVAMVLGIVGLLTWLATGSVNRMTRAGEPLDRQFRDFYEFYSGAEALVRGTDLYKAGELGYIYPPLLAVLMAPLVSLGIQVAGVVWLCIRLALLVLILVLGADEMTRRFNLRRDAMTFAAFALGVLLLLADKLRAEMNMGQSNLLMVLCWLLALRWMVRRPVLAGVALGFGANIKYVTLAAVPYLLLRKRFAAAGATVGSAALWALVPALYLGWSQNAEYLVRAMRGLAGMAGDPAEAVGAKVMPVQSIGVAITSWAARQTASAGMNLLTVALVGAVAGAFGLAVVMLYRRYGVKVFNRPAGEQGMGDIVALEWSLLIIAVLCFGPQTNSPHLVQMLIPVMVAVACLLSTRRVAVRWVVGIGCAVLVAGFVLPPGGVSARESVVAWQRAAGPSWCMLVFALCLCWAVVSEHRHRSALGA